VFKKQQPEGPDPMNPAHADLLAELKALARPIPPDWPTTDSYGGSGHLFYRVSVPERRTMARRWIAANKQAPTEDVLVVIDSLFQGESHEEKTLAALLLDYHAAARRKAVPADLDRWLSQLNGWAEVDSLCQNRFSAEEMLADWPAWRGMLERFSKDSDINKRRAAMVLLNAPVHKSDDPRFRDLALAVIERLMDERDILITKAVSWLLRSMAARHREAVERCLAEHAERLPKIAIRETRTKLATGTKSGRSKRT
jgi:3-methyladenine DNA glycosylase AlkD